MQKLQKKLYIALRYVQNALCYAHNALHYIQNTLRYIEFSGKKMISHLGSESFGAGFGKLRWADFLNNQSTRSNLKIPDTPIIPIKTNNKR